MRTALYEAHVDGKYHDCISGKVYLSAANMGEAAKLLPDAKSIKELGPFFVPVED